MSRLNSKRRFSSLAAAISAAVFAGCVLAKPSQAADGDDVSRAAAAVGCELGGPWAATLRPLPSEPDLHAVATVSGDSTANDGGVLCVGVVQMTRSDFKKVAGLNGAPHLPADVNPITNTYVTIDSIPFRISPTEAAFAVRVTEEFNSTSTNYNSTELYLFRRRGNKLNEIFHANVGDELLDKTNDAAGARKHRLIVKFSNRLHRGAYDLILSRDRGGSSRRFIWSGSRYVAT
ncbi:MAG TPA: hypothetical protein VMD53_16520 [Rhizomicrobium sp.]|nr:hypothetical protein [Rhizomicrobium sp.]